MIGATNEYLHEMEKLEQYKKLGTVEELKNKSKRRRCS